MAEHPNVGLVRRLFADKADPAEMAALLSDDLVWHAAGRNRLSGDHVGKAAVYAMWGKMAEMMAQGATMERELHAVLADDDHAVALVRVTGGFQGRSLDAQQIVTLHISNGRITEGWVSFHDPYSVDEFWG
jgi:hypothetical protein